MKQLLKLAAVCFLLTASAVSGFAQKLSLKVENAPLKEVLASIEAQSGKHFFYNSSEVDESRKVTINLREVELSEALDRLFSGTSVKARISGNDIVLSKDEKTPAKSSFDGTVRGVVTDSQTGETLIGAGVVVEGTTRGVNTDLDGAYSIEAGADETLVFSSLGYKTKSVNINGKSSINVTLDSDINTLDAVVVMGYSSMKKAELSSSVTSVEGDDLRDVVSTDIGSLLQGKVAGVSVSSSSGQPGSSATIRIRGTGSISASSSPLYVVDGVVGGSFSPNDIETITVLKDAGSTALYGASGAGGVIVVTTKQAKRGQDAIVDFKATAGVKSALHGRFHPMDAYEFGSYLKTINKNFYVPKDLDSHNFNWMDESERTGLTQNYYASASGSKGNLTYLASLDYFDETGTWKWSDYQRMTGRLNLGTEILKGLTMNIHSYYNYYKGHSNGVSVYSQVPFDNPRDVNTGEYVEITSSRRPDNNETWYGHDKNNPLYTASKNDANYYGSESMFDVQFIWAITDKLSFTTTNRYDDGTSHSWSEISPESNDGTYPDGYVYENVSWGRSFNTTNLLKWSDTFDGGHSVSALLGQEWGKSKSSWISGSATGIYNGLDVFNTMTTSNVAGTWQETEAWSLFAQATYSYKEKYILNATFRADANSVFAPNNRVGYFPSVSGAWVASSEDFFKNQDLLSFLKLRASFGTTGNSGLTPYSYLDVYAFSDYGKAIQYEGATGGIPSSVANPDLKWETAVMTNLGVDVSFGNFLTVNLDAYNNENRDLLLEVPLPLDSGFDTRIENTGRIRNRGLEIQILTDNIKRRDLKWSTSFNIAFNRNTVTYLPNHEDIIPSSAYLRQIYREGEPLFSWYGPKWLGVDPANGDPLWEHLIKDENGNVIGTEPTNVVDETNDSQILGNAQPKFTGGLFNSVEAFGFELGVNFQFVYGNKVFNWTRKVMDSDGAYTDYNSMSLDNGLGWSRWEKEGDIATHPKPRTGGNKNANASTSRYLEDGSYLRLKNVSLSYNIPRELVRKVKLQSAKLTLSADNLWTYTRFSGTDPEVDLAGSLTSVAGLFSYNYPVGRLISLSLSARF